jgi:dTMP kinase
MRNRLIVIDGTDSSGKNTQARLLLKYLRKKGKKAVLISFPRYGTYFGKLIRKYLAGGFGNPAKLAPEFCALLYAMDRYDEKENIERKLRAGYWVICDRYVQSNMAHQAAKFASRKKQDEFIGWVAMLESGMPKAGKVFFIDMPVEISQKLMKSRKGKTKDAHERNVPYLKRTLEIYKRLAKKQKWHWIKAAKNREIKLISEIHNEIISKI